MQLIAVKEKTTDRRKLYITAIAAAAAVIALAAVVVFTVIERRRTAERMLAQAHVHLNEGRFDTAEQIALVLIARYRRWSEHAVVVLADVNVARQEFAAQSDAERAIRTERAFAEQAERIDTLAQRFGGLEFTTASLGRELDQLGRGMAQQRVRSEELADLVRNVESAVNEQQIRSAVLTELVEEIAAREPVLVVAQGDQITPPVAADTAIIANALVVEGIEYYLAGEFAQAEATLRRAVETDPNDEQARAYLAAAMYEVNPLDADRRRAAIELAQNSATSGEAAVVAQYTLGQIYNQEGAIDRAIAAYDTALSLHPNHVPSNRAMGRLLFQAGRLDAADEHWSRVAIALPDDQDVRFDLLRLAIARGDWHQAVDYGEQLVAAGSRAPAAYAWLAEAERALNNCSVAIAHWQYAYELNPRWQYLERSAACHVDSGDRAMAADYYLRAVAQHPKNSSEARTEAYRLVETAVSLLSEPEPNRRTLDAAERGAQLLDSDPRAQMLLGSVHESLDNARRASEIYSELIESNRLVDGVYLALGRTYIVLDEDTQRAERLLRDLRRSGNENEYRELQQMIDEYTGA